MHSWSHMYPWVLGCARTPTHTQVHAYRRGFWRFWRGRCLCVNSFLWRDFPLVVFPSALSASLCQIDGCIFSLFFLEASTSSWPLTSHSILHAFPPRIITNSTQQSWLGLTHMSTGLINARSFFSFAAAAAAGERSPYPNSTLLRLPSPLAVTVLWCFVSIVSCFFFFPRRAHRGCLQTLSLFPCWFSHSHRKRFRWTAFFWVFLFAQVSTVLLLEININTSFSAMYQTRTASFVKDSI